MSGFGGWFALAAVALVIGSFLGTLIERLPRGAEIATGRSACTACGSRLAAYDLVPLLSWLWLRGRCRHCGARIGLFCPAVELGALAVALSAAMIDSGPLLWVSCLFGWALLTLALIDLRDYLLPDAITLPLLAAGLVATWYAAPAELAGHLAGALCGFLVFALIAALYRRWRGRDGLGRGDMKLVAALGAWVGWSGLPSLVFLAAMSALAMALARHAAGKSLSPGDSIAFGPYLAGAGWLVWLHGPLFPGLA